MGYPILLDWLVNRDSHKGRFHHPYKPRAVWPIWHPTTWGVFCCWTWIVLGAVFGTSWYRNQPGSERGVIVKRELSIESEILWDGTVYLRDHRSYIHFCLRGWILNLWQLGGGCKNHPSKGGIEPYNLPSHGYRVFSNRTPAAFEIVDANASVSNITFPDEDLDVNEVGGASWISSIGDDGWMEGVFHPSDSHYILGKKNSWIFFFDTGIVSSHEFQYYPISASIVQIQVDTRIKII